MILRKTQFYVTINIPTFNYIIETILYERVTLFVVVIIGRFFFYFPKKTLKLSTYKT